MKSAYTFKEEFNDDGKCTRRERDIGAIVPWSIVALVALLTGKALLGLPASLWESFTK
jgi:hypothetical protein